MAYKIRFFPKNMVSKTITPHRPICEVGLSTAFNILETFLSKCVQLKLECIHSVHVSFMPQNIVYINIKIVDKEKKSNFNSHFQLIINQNVISEDFKTMFVIDDYFLYTLQTPDDSEVNLQKYVFHLKKHYHFTAKSLLTAVQKQRDRGHMSEG